MNDALPTGLDALSDEARRYLAVVDLFRALNCEPTWRPESRLVAPAPAREHPRLHVEKSAH